MVNRVNKEGDRESYSLFIRLIDRDPLFPENSVSSETEKRSLIPIVYMFKQVLTTSAFLRKRLQFLLHGEKFYQWLRKVNFNPFWMPP